MTSREMFEKLFVPTAGGNLARYNNGSYMDDYIDMAWRAWLMSASVHLKEVKNGLT